jgi:hypothetical protein
MINKRKLYSVALVSTAIILGLISIAGAASQLTPEITWSNPASIVYGTPLSSTQLDATASDKVSGATVPGTFVYTPPVGTVLSTGKHTLHAYFTPSDSTKYTTVPATVLINVNKVTSTIT